MSAPPSPKERLRELLAGQALGEKFSPEEERDLGILLAEFPDVDPESYTFAAAAIHIALLAASIEKMPMRLRQRLIRIANLLAGSHRKNPSPLRAPWLGWAAAAAATILLIAQPMKSGGASSFNDVRDAPDSISVAWAPTEDPTGALATGTVVWSNQLKAGFMSFEGLPANAPDQSQYQLWIFDAERPAEHPVDGGVFDSPGAAFQVSIDPKISVEKATLFAITLERPGGVVVSSRERLLLTAAP
jgi:hypothetical protein